MSRAISFSEMILAKGACVSSCAESLCVVVRRVVVEDSVVEDGAEMGIP